MSAFLLVHILTPALGVAVFLAIKRQMQLAGVANALLLPYFVIHAFYGGLLLIGLTRLFWEWSGMASLGMFACLIFGPIVLLGQAWWLRGRRTQSGFHAAAFGLSLGYPLCLAGLIVWAMRAHP